MFVTLMLFLKRIFLILKKKTPDDEHHELRSDCSYYRNLIWIFIFSITSAEREQMTVVRSGGKRVNPLHAW